ncbi:MAG: DNA methyltransferase [Verrucomicrobiota bacterium]
MPDSPTDEIAAFISRWEKSGGHERGSGQLFLSELCDLLALPKPDPPREETALNEYVFERRVNRTKPDGSTVANFIDLYKKGHFVLETKQGVNPDRDKENPDQPLLKVLEVTATAKASGHGKRGTPAWDKALERAHAQASRYIHALPVEDGRPPFLIVCDVGHSIDLYAEFSGTGGQYERFPDPVSHRILLSDLHDENIRRRLRAIWTDPKSLDPSKHAAKVTREVASTLAELAKLLEKDGHDPHVTAGFLQRCLFTMFAEDIGLLPKACFLRVLEGVREEPAGFQAELEKLWQEMATGATYSVIIKQAIPHFNGGLFDDTTALPLNAHQIRFLIHAARSDWSAVEPAIFGTLLERALDPRERHKLGAHYTPRSYVERLVRPTIIEPLREQWEAVKTAAAQLDEQGELKAARDTVAEFHHELCRLRILDPACGSGNFLYVSLELLKRLEAEVLDLYGKLGGNLTLEMAEFKVRPDQFLGLEINERAVAIAQLVLWIGYFQWHRKTTGKADTNDRPLLPKHATIRQQDAVLAYDEKVPRLDSETGQPVTIWDGRTTKPHPVTGREVPDEDARRPLYDFTNPRRAEWPTADYVVGNPPFIGASRMRESLGDGYTEALRKAWKGRVPESADFVMYWWRKAAELTAAAEIRRFGFITTNSIHQTFNRRVLEPFLSDTKRPLHLAFAIPDHPWVDSADGAAVRIAMTVADRGKAPGLLIRVEKEWELEDGEHEVKVSRSTGPIIANLQRGVDVASCQPLKSNAGLSCPGVKLHGSGFIVTRSEAENLTQANPAAADFIKEYRNGKDLTKRPRGVLVIDLLGLSEIELQDCYPSLYQHVFNFVKPDRDAKAHTKDGKAYAEKWWLFGKTRAELRHSLEGLSRYVATVETSKHRFFEFLDAQVLPDNMLIAIAVSNPPFLSILSSKLHLIWAQAQGGTLEDRPRYNKSVCFDPFPFPAMEGQEIGNAMQNLGEHLDAHRKQRQAQHPELTMTGMYNVLEKLRREEPLSDKEKAIHDDGLVTVLKQIHDDIDAAVLEAYGWGDLQPEGAKPLADRLAAGDDAAEELEQEILSRLVALNHERAEEEERGLIRWLRPEYQAPEASGLPKAKQTEIELAVDASAKKAAAPAQKLAWPDKLSDQVAALQRLLPNLGQDVDALDRAFGRRSKRRRQEIGEILQTFSSLGKI